MLKVISFDKSISLCKRDIKNINHSIVKFSSYPYCILFNNLIAQIISSKREIIEIISHYDILSQLLYYSFTKNKIVKLKLLNNKIVAHNEQIIYINSIIFKKYIRLKLNNMNINHDNQLFNIGCHIRMGDNCMHKNETCKIDTKRLLKVVSIYNRLCYNKSCKLIISSDSVLFISKLREYIPKIITYGKNDEIYHSSGISKNNHYTESFYNKLLGDICILTTTDYLILSSKSTFSLLILYLSSSNWLNYNNFEFDDGTNDIYDPLYNEMNKRKKKCKLLKV